ncbi:uncharacterized protein LOC114254940 [Monomorium pharaonis]|uniref:uncharacterized protein LOC114254940 n=1 Tax=Monomorium pharaonis TaxID=307658 RepID=UPI00102E1119|nr:uncharacterized protein LOC114254940 [Monomorium pharaonis]
MPSLVIRYLRYSTDIMAEQRNTEKQSSSENIGETKTNILIQQLVPKEINGDTSHLTHLQTEENEENNNVRYATRCKGMTQRRQRCWIWQYCNKLHSSYNKSRKRECNICHKVCHNNKDMKVHLYRYHEIYNNEDVIDRSNLIWQYYTEEMKYTARCKICDKLLSGGYRKYNLEDHLIRRHLPTITKAILQQVEYTWALQYFMIDTLNSKKIKCKICDKMHNIFQIDNLQEHLLLHGIKETTEKRTKEINVDITTNQDWLLPNSAINQSIAEKKNISISLD